MSNQLQRHDDALNFQRTTDDPKSAVFKRLNRAGPTTASELPRHPSPDERRVYAIRSFNPLPGTTTIWYLDRHNNTRVLKRWMVENRTMLRRRNVTGRTLSSYLDSQMTPALHQLLELESFTFLETDSDGGEQPNEISSVTCPRCGESVKNLPNHIRACDGTPEDTDI